MLSSKQRSSLRAIANRIDSICHIGKAGITPTVLAQFDDALNAREIVKAHVLHNSGIDARHACSLICEQLSAFPVCVIGNRFVVFRQSEKKIIAI